MANLSCRSLWGRANLSIRAMRRLKCFKDGKKAMNKKILQRELSSRYERYNDAALLDIEPSSLTDLAQQILSDEIAKRGLIPLSEDGQGKDTVHDRTDGTVVWTGSVLEEAAVVLHLLEFSAIQASFVPLPGRGSSNRLQVTVLDVDAERAIEVIAGGTSRERAEELVALLKNSTAPVPLCISCGSQLVHLRSLGKGNCWSCEACGEAWEETLLPMAVAEPPNSPDLGDLEESEVAATNEKKRRMAKRSNSQSVVIITILITGAVVYNMHLPWDFEKTVAFLIWIPAQVLWVISRWQLGSNFSAKPEARELVTDGVYARIRNPIYIFGTISSVSLVLYLGKPWFLIFLIVLIPIQVIRAINEKRVLLQTFDEKYKTYERQTWF